MQFGHFLFDEFCLLKPIKKMKPYFIFSLTFLIAVALTVSSCKKKDDPADDIPPVGTVEFHLHTYIEDNEVDLYNIPYTTHAGRSISLSLAQLFISNVELIKPDGSTYAIPNNKILKKLDVDTYIIGDAPVGNYKSIRFKVGLGPETNVPDLKNITDSVMWFSNINASQGYIFLNVRGKIDTSAAMTGTLVPFVYRIGTNANYKQVTMPDKAFSVTAGEITYAHLMADYNMLFNGITLTDNSNLFVRTVADNTTPLALKIVNNIPSMFKYEP
jgi:hypothetical protein